MTKVECRKMSQIRNSIECSIPCGTASVSAFGTRPSSFQRASFGLESARNMTGQSILIIEDDPVLLRGLKDNFETAGFCVRTANDGRKGLDALLAEPPDLLLLDLMLPKLNGYEICQAARSRQFHMPIMMLTAKGQED